MSDSKVYMVPDGNNSINPALMLAMSQNGGFGGGANWMWPMFMFFLFPWLFMGGNGFGGFGGFGNGAFGNIAGTGYLANQLSNDVGRDLLLQAINGRADALSQLANLLHTDVATVQSGVNTIQSSIQSVGSQVGLSGAQVINAVQSGNASLSQQLCQCCCDNRLAIAELTNTLLAQSAANHAATQLGMCLQTNALLSQAAANQNALLAQLAAHDADVRLGVCQLTNTLQNLAERDTNTITSAIAALQTNITKEFCDIRERELLSKINTQGDIITQLRGQLDNDRQTAQLYSAIAPIQAKVNEISNKQPNTVPVEWPNLTAVNNTPNVGFGYGWGNGFWGNGFGNGIVF